MQILLIKKKEGLGDEGDIISVADGYARNYLIPRKYAMKAAKNTIELQKKLVAGRSRKIAEELDECKALGEKISTLSLTIPVKVGADDYLYGSVTSADVVRLLTEEGIEIAKSKVLLEKPIKNLGVYAIDVEVHPEIKATMKLWVVKE